MSDKTVKASSRPENDPQAAPEQEERSEQQSGGDGSQQASDDLQTGATETEEMGTEEDALQSLEDRIRELENELSETNERLLRQAADLQNFRRRAEKEKTRIVASSKSRVLKPMLDVLDDLERSLQAAEQFDESEEKIGAAYTSLRDGVELVMRKFQGELERLGVEQIEAEGEVFDENEHEALMQQPAPEDAEPGTILQEIQKGYRLGDRVLRHSKVVVASEG